MTGLSTCPACGFDGLDEPPYSPTGAGSYEFCPCCNFQYGVSDVDRGWTFEKWRERWVEMGMPWDPLTAEAPPDGWDPSAQLRNVT